MVDGNQWYSSGPKGGAEESLWGGRSGTTEGALARAKAPAREGIIQVGDKSTGPNMVDVKMNDVVFARYYNARSDNKVGDFYSLGGWANSMAPSAPRAASTFPSSSRR